MVDSASVLIAITCNVPWKRDPANCQPLDTHFTILLKKSTDSPFLSPPQFCALEVADNRNPSLPMAVQSGKTTAQPVIW